MIQLCDVRRTGTDARAYYAGYFKFGGSTIVCLFNNVQFDPDLVENSKNSVRLPLSSSRFLELTFSHPQIETLVRVGMRIGRKVE